MKAEQCLEKNLAFDTAIGFCQAKRRTGIKEAWEIREIGIKLATSFSLPEPSHLHGKGESDEEYSGSIAQQQTKRGGRMTLTGDNHTPG